MLSEFALTPSIFDEEAQPDADLWREQLDQLLSNMFPNVSAWPVMVSNLHSGSWQETALQMISRVKDHRAKKRCQELLQNASKTLVSRPACCDWPDDDFAWGREAVESHAAEPIDRILMTGASHEILGKQCKSVRRLDEVQDAGFWRGIAADASPPMKISDQVALLRKICVHSEFLCLINPYIQGGGNDETDFAVELVRSALNRPPGFPPVQIEIHTKSYSDGSDSPDLSKYESGVARALKPALGVGQQLRLVFWPKFVERALVAGVYAPVAPGQRRRSPRWGVSMTHIARRSDVAIPDFTEWKLLRHDSLGRWFGKYCQEGVAGYVRAFPVTR